jgi:lipopolysaccharide export system protein LptC
MKTIIEKIHYRQLWNDEFSQIVTDTTDSCKKYDSETIHNLQFDETGIKI